MHLKHNLMESHNVNEKWMAKMIMSCYFNNLLSPFSYSQHQCILTLRLFNPWSWRHWCHYFWGKILVLSFLPKALALVSRLIHVLGLYSNCLHYTYKRMHAYSSVVVLLKEAWTFQPFTDACYSLQSGNCRYTWSLLLRLTYCRV